MHWEELKELDTITAYFQFVHVVNERIEKNYTKQIEMWQIQNLTIIVSGLLSKQKPKTQEPPSEPKYIEFKDTIKENNGLLEFYLNDELVFILKKNVTKSTS